MSASAPDKAKLREHLRAVRNAVSADDAADAAARIGVHLEPMLAGKSVVAGFSSTQNEVDLTPLYEHLLARGVALCFPRVEGPGTMVFADIQQLDELRPGAFGIAEPGGAPREIETIDVFLVPGLGFDHRGGRLGFGGGYYDRALARRQEVGDKVPLLLGIGYSCQLLETDLPTDDWDIRVDSVITEDGIIQT